MKTYFFGDLEDLDHINTETYVFFQLPSILLI